MPVIDEAALRWVIEVPPGLGQALTVERILQTATMTDTGVTSMANPHPLGAVRIQLLFTEEPKSTLFGLKVRFAYMPMDATVWVGPCE